MDFEGVTDAKASLLAIMLANGLQKELECNSELLAKLHLMLVERLWEKEATSASGAPRLLVDYFKEVLFPASVGPWNDG
jgi:hypothetical protein